MRDDGERGVEPPAALPRTIGAIAWDPANAVTLAGLSCAVLGAHAVVLDEPRLGAALAGLALLADMLDGSVARRQTARASVMARAGGLLDALCDVVHGGVLPGLLLVAVVGSSPVTVLVATALAVCAVLRLAFFALAGPRADGSYTGVPVIFSTMAACLFVAAMDLPAVAVLFPTVLAVLAVLNVTSVRIPKLAGVALLAFNGLAAASVAANLALWTVSGRVDARASVAEHVPSVEIEP
ncbi:CDP-alcohol phosphatidyltransferase family protein [Salinarimonas rosea]|uniref:CDP-alcohol phosphatidyltransferase family protein n=1 Tax=Salinarimonas rosea TaxID=552063 RepID=UPI0003FF1748|nr:CDP-alcohol phosphatidyltransferase family protein [Salinarimonas rosea]